RSPGGAAHQGCDGNRGRRDWLRSRGALPWTPGPALDARARAGGRRLARGHKLSPPGYPDRRHSPFRTLALRVEGACRNQVVRRGRLEAAATHLRTVTG